MQDLRLHADIAEIKQLVRDQAELHRRADLVNEGRMARLEIGTAEIKTDIAEIKSTVASIDKRGDLDHDEITRLKSQMTIRSAGWAILSTVVSLAGAFMGLRPHN